jgi:uncharacterized metal-binding protein YceD (DUF177 family)
MPLLVNLRHLADQNLVLNGELPSGELDIDDRDEMIRVEQPLRYELEAQKLEQNLLLRGRLRLTLNCQCVRCLKAFAHRLEIAPWTCHIPLTGEDRAPVVNDCVDLTPYLREDILLGFPQHPLCHPGCGGLVKTQSSELKESRPAQTETGSPAWAELDKLKL